MSAAAALASRLPAWVATRVSSIRLTKLHATTHLWTSELVAATDLAGAGLSEDHS
jgi:hypothetical protein